MEVDRIALRLSDEPLEAAITHLLVLGNRNNHSNGQVFFAITVVSRN